MKKMGQGNNSFWGLEFIYIKAGSLFMYIWYKITLQIQKEWLLEKTEQYNHTFIQITKIYAEYVG